MARIKHNLIKKEDIKEEIKLIKGSKTDYISSIGNIYKDYGNGLFYPKKNYINKHNGYVYSGITYPNGNKQRRVHILVAEAWIPNPDNKPIVMHKDNNKQNNSINNLKWGTISENTKQAYDDGLAINDKGFTDSQSQPVIMYDVYTKQPIKIFGSCRICAKENPYNISLHAIIEQCKKYTSVRHPVYFRYLKDGNINPPKIIIQYDYYTDKEINRYCNSWDAERKTNISYKTISQQCINNFKPKHETKSGYYFMYG